MNKLESGFIKNIAINYPIALNVLDSCMVLKREFIGSGSFTHFEPIATPLLSEQQILKSHNVFRLDDGIELSAQLQLNNGVPDYLEIRCLNWAGWDGSFSSFSIKQ